MRRIRITVLGSLAAVLVLAGCGDVAEKATEEAIERSSGGEGDVDLDLDDEGGSIKVETEEGSLEYDIDGSGDGSLPDGFPGSVPIIDGYSVQAGSKQSFDDETSYTATGSVDGEPAEVYAEVIDQFESDGWETVNNFEQTSDGGFTGTATFRDGEHDVTVAVYGDPSDDGATFVGYTVTPTQE